MKYKIILLLMVAFSFQNCESERRAEEDLTKDQASKLVKVDALLQATYDGMKNPYQDQSRFWAAQEHTTDATMGPTRDQTGTTTESGDHCTPTHGQQTTPS